MHLSFAARPLSAAKTLVLIFALTLAAGPLISAFGQSTQSISGTVRDKTGAVIPGAPVVVRALGTGLERSLKSNEQGLYSAQNLDVGNYTVTARSPGFATEARTGITLDVGSALAIDFALAVGEESQTITVEGGAAQVETTSNAVGSLVDEKQMRDLPLNGRNFEQLILLAPGVQQVTSGSKGSLYGRSNSYSIAGSRPEGQAILLDGTDIQGYWNRGTGASNVGTSLGVEAIGEFRTLVNTYGAQYGGDGGVITAVTKSGTNNLHGSAYDFLRNSVFDARNYFDCYAGQVGCTRRIPAFHRNQFGASLGGPIKREKAFFFVNYEGLREELGKTSAALVPNANTRAGYLPCSQVPGGTCIASEPYAGTVNVGVNAKIAPILALYPTANSDNGDGTGTARIAANQPTSENYVNGRFDYVFNPTNAIFARYVSDRATLTDPFSGGTITGFPELDIAKDQYFTMEERHIFSSKVINLLRLSFVRNYQSAATTQNPPALNFYPGSAREDGSLQVPGLSNIGANAGIPVLFVQNKFTYADDLYWTRGSHNITLGLSVGRNQNNALTDLYDGAEYVFSSLANLLSASPTLLLGALPGQDDSYRAFREITLTPYLQDDWKVSDRLTVNLGVRYSFVTNAVGLNNKLFALPNAPTGTAFTPVSHVLASNASLKNIDPRIGFVYDPFGDHKTSIRAGFGIFHDVIEANSYGPSYYLAPPYSIGQQIFPTNFGSPFSSGSGATLPTITYALNYQTKSTPYQMQYNLNLQREVAKDTIVTVAYVGARGVHQFVNRDLNPPTRTFNSDGSYSFASPVATPTACPSASMTPPCFIGRVVSNPSVNPALGSLDYNNAASSSNYHSMQVSANKSFSKGFQVQASYTFSKCLDYSSVSRPLESNNGSNAQEDPYNLNRDYGPCNFDVRQNVIANVLYALPFKGNAFIKGWAVTGIFSGHTGSPFTVTDGFDAAGLKNQADIARPNLVPGHSNNALLKNVNHWYDTSAFAPTAVGAIGNLGRNTLSGPGFENFDLGLRKETAVPQISEAARVEFRAEAFNLFNHANFGLPSQRLYAQAQPICTAATLSLCTSPSATYATPLQTAGQITTTTNTSRQIQFAIKLLF